jgi:D-glycero-D-manno-heptose 1,7-bisphosphate phosphatase
LLNRTPVNESREAKVVGKFVLLDRDGVINRRKPDGYFTSWAEFEFLEGAREGNGRLTQNGYAAIVVSNQACVGKGLLSHSELASITRRFVEEVEKTGGRIHDVYYCTHRKEEGCECRKPQPGLILEAQRKHQFNFASTFMIGDSPSDLQAARTVGCPALLISHMARACRKKLRTGHAAGLFRACIRRRSSSLQGRRPEVEIDGK